MGDLKAPALALVSLALAVIIVLLSRLPRRALVLVLAAAIGAIAGSVLLGIRTESQTCDFSYVPPNFVDRCSGTYVQFFGWHRLPQFMQDHDPDRFMMVVGVLAEMVVACALALVAMWVWSRVRTSRHRVPETWARG